MKTYNESTSKELFQELKDWKFKDNAIEKKFVFKDFSQALGFIVQVGLRAEKQAHHPELSNVYNKVTIRLSTHDVNGVTDKDFKLAEAIDSIV